MNLLEQFTKHYSNNLSIYLPANSKFILAVSGGVDSIVLVDLFINSNIDFSIAHCNFNLRAEESKRDEEFVKALALQHSKEINIKNFDTEKYALDNKLSIQIAARQLRYNWFYELQTNSLTAPAYLVTAHHCNDNIETVLFNFFRGTGIQGLAGISAFDKERKIIRPLLPFKKEALLQYATTKGLRFVEDSSNASNKYTRNSFRNQIIPLVATHFPQVECNIVNNISKMNDVLELYNQSIETHKKNLIEQRGDEFHIPVLKLKKSVALQTIIWEIIKGFNFSSAQINEVIKLLNASNGSYIQSASHRIILNRKWIIISPLQASTSQHFTIEKGDKKLIFNNKVLAIEFVDALNLQHATTASTATLDLSCIEFPLLLRKWKQGDYFYPLGMTKKQKLSKFFINQKLSLLQKENIWVIESNKKIVWVVGYRIDNRCKLTATTKQAMTITLLDSTEFDK